MKRYKLMMVLLIATAVFLLPSPTHAQGTGQEGGPGKATTAPPASQKPVWRIDISRINSQSFVTLNASNAPLTDVAAELSKKLNVPITLSNVMKQQQITLKIEKQPLETALLMLAPQSQADYEVGGAAGAPPKLLAVYLQAYNEPQPPVVLKGDNSVVVFEGNTEDGVATTADSEPPLKVTFEKNRLSVISHQQSLISVLSEIAGRLGCQFSVRNMSDETVDLNLRDVALEDAPRLISPAARFRLRTNLSTQEKVLLQVILDAKPARAAMPDSTNHD